MNAEVAVIGAGVHGASAAFHLSRLGVKPIIIDRGAPAGGPTGRSSAICRAYYTNEFLAEVAHESMGIFRRFPDLTQGRPSGFRPSGMLYLHGPGDRRVLEATVAMLNKLGTVVDLLDRDRLGTEFPAFDLEGLAFGAYERDAGYADPVQTTQGLVERAVELGAVTRFYCAVSRLTPRAAGGVNLELADGTHVECERLLITGGPWTRELAAQCGAELPLSVERHYVASFRWGGAPPMPYGHADIVSEYYVRPDGDALFLAGPLHAEARADPDRYSATIATAEVEKTATRLMTRVPSLQAAASTGGWASLYDVSPDWQPVIGAIAPGIFVDAGTSGHGFKLAPALGRHVADLVLGRPVNARLSQFSPERFHAGGQLAAGYGNARILG